MPTHLDMHISEELLESYSMARLPKDQLDSLEEHIILCAACQDRLAETDRFVSMMREATRRLCSAPEPQRRLWNSRAALGGLALASAFALILAVPNHEESGRQEISLIALRGPESTANLASPNRPITLRINVMALPVATYYALDIVNSEGRHLWRGRSGVQEDGHIVQLVGPLPAGQYWVRLSDAAAPVLLREFNLLVTE